MKIFEKVASKAYLHNAPSSYAAPVKVLRGRLPVETTYRRTADNFYEGETIHVCSLPSSEVNCEGGGLESTSRTVMVIIKKEFPTFVKGSREIAVAGDGETSEELVKRQQKIVKFFYASVGLSVGSLAIILAFPAVLLWFSVFIFVTGVVATCILAAVSDSICSKIIAAKESQAEIGNNPQTQSSRKGGVGTYNKICAGDVWVVQHEIGERMVALLKEHNADNALATLFTTKLDLFPTVYEMYMWLIELENIFTMNAKFPVDLIPFDSSRANTVKRELKAQKNRARSTFERLENHRKGVLEEFATQDSVQREQLAIEHIKFMED